MKFHLCVLWCEDALLMLKYYLQFILDWINTKICGDFYQTLMPTNLSAIYNEMTMYDL